MSLTRYNYLKKNKQLATLTQFKLVIEEKLKNFLDSQTGAVAENKTFEDLKQLLSDGKLTIKQGIFTLDEQFKKLSDDTSETISKREIEDVEILLKYFQDIEHLLIATDKLMDTLEPPKSHAMFNKSRTHDQLMKLLKLCREQYHYLEHAIDINIYRVVIPANQYDSIYNESKSFHYEGRAIAAAKVTGGTLFYFPAVAIAFIPYLLLLVPHMLRDIPGVVRIYNLAHRFAVTVDKYTQEKCAQAVEDGITHFGFGCQSNISREWVQALVTMPHSEIANPYYGGHPAEAINTVYIIDARNPMTVFEEGINYTELNSPLNPHGKVICFKKLKHARECADRRIDGAFYDKAAGWRLNHAWKEKQLADVYSFHKLKKIIISSAKLPASVVDITTEYLGRPTRRP